MCQFEAQIVDVRDGLTDLFVVHRCAGPFLQMRRGGVLGELRQFGATKVHIPKKREPVPCFALYTLDPYAVPHNRYTKGGVRRCNENS